MNIFISNLSVVKWRQKKKRYWTKHLTDMLLAVLVQCGHDQHLTLRDLVNARVLMNEMPNRQALLSYFVTRALAEGAPSEVFPQRQAEGRGHTAFTVWAVHVTERPHVLIGRSTATDLLAALKSAQAAYRGCRFMDQLPRTPTRLSWGVQIICGLESLRDTCCLWLMHPSGYKYI